MSLEIAEATPLPLNVDSERCFPDEPGGVAETVRLLADAGAAGCSVEDFDPATGEIEAVEAAAARVAGCGVRAARAHSPRREPSPRRRRSRRHDRPAGGVPRRGRRRGLRAGPRRPWLDLAARRRGRHTGQRARVAKRPDRRRAGQNRRPPRLHRRGSGHGSPTAPLLQGAAELRDAGTSRYSEGGAPAEALRAALGDG